MRKIYRSKSYHRKIQTFYAGLFYKFVGQLGF